MKFVFKLMVGDFLSSSFLMFSLFEIRCKLDLCFMVEFVLGVVILFFGGLVLWRSCKSLFFLV